MLQLTRPRKTWLALLPMFHKGIIWSGPQTLLIRSENLWAWMDKKLGDRSVIKDTAELQVKLTAIRNSITTKQLSKYFSSMRDRMKHVTELQGAHIGLGLNHISLARSHVSLALLALSHNMNTLCIILVIYFFRGLA